jgi:hypothetical protein
VLKKAFSHSKASGKCSFDRINGKGILPYTVKYVLLFYLHFMAQMDLQYL